jgi:acetyl-CoA carboxylase biotin carboxyl carrier protein
MATEGQGVPVPADPPDVELATDRATAHDEIARLADDLVPALSAALAASGLAELELREAGWRIRVRRGADAAVPADGETASRRRGAERGRSHSTERPRSHDGQDGSTNGTSAAAAAERESGRPDPPSVDRFRVVATSPGVGHFRPAPNVPPGTRVRAGDRLGAVDVLGVPQEVTAPADGIVMATLVEADQAVEYGQPLVELERMSGTPAVPGAIPVGEG